MEIFRYINRISNLIVLFKTMNSSFFLLLILIQIKCFLSEYFDSFQTGNLEGDSLIDMSDYYNISLVITTDKKIYTGIPPTFKSSTSSKIISISSAVTYNNNYILMACTEDYLLTKISIETGEETPLVNYTKFTKPNCTCSISTNDNLAYIGISNIIIPTYKINKSYFNTMDDNLIKTDGNSIELDSLNYTEINNTNVNNDEDYFIYYDYNNTYLENGVIKIKLKNEVDGNEPILDDNFDIVNYTFQYKHKNLEHIPLSRSLSCEIVDVEDVSSKESRLVCGYIISNEKSDNSFNYFLIYSVINNNFSDIEDESKTEYKHKTMPNIRLQKINSTHIKYIVSEMSYEVTVKKDNGICSLIIFFLHLLLFYILKKIYLKIISEWKRILIFKILWATMNPKETHYYSYMKFIQKK